MQDEKIQPQYQAIERDYQRNVRVVSLRPRLLSAALFVWALIDVALLVFFIVTVVLYVVSGSFADERLVAGVARNTGALHKVALTRVAEPMVVEDVRILARDTGSYDLYSVVENTNSEWYVTFDYFFTAGSITTSVARGALMPGQSSYLLGLDVDAGSRPSGAEITLQDIVWERVDRHAVANTAEFLVQHEDFQVTEGTYATDVELTEDTVGRSLFTIKNNTAYSYISPTFLVLLKRAGVVVAVNQVLVSEFLTGESRDISVHWFGAVPTSATVEVIPTINYFDENIYMTPPGELGEDMRDSFDDRR